MSIINWYLGWCDRWMPGYSRPDPGDVPDEAPCDRCETPIDPQSSHCPECGNYPFKSAKWTGVILMLVGLVLSITVVGAIVGVPLFVVGLAVRLGGATLSPTDHDFGSSADV